MAAAGSLSNRDVAPGLCQPSWRPPVGSVMKRPGRCQLLRAQKWKPPRARHKEPQNRKGPAASRTRLSLSRWLRASL